MGMLTPNDSTTYLVGFLNLERTGPLVIDYPKGPTAGGILDMWQRPITDMGLSGPDKGEGGKYLVLPPGQKAPKDAEGYRVFESPTNNVFHGFRVLTTDPKASGSAQEQLSSLPVRQTRQPPQDADHSRGREEVDRLAGKRPRVLAAARPRCSTRNPSTSATA